MEAPHAKQLLKLDSDEVKGLQEQQVAGGLTESESGNKFTCYAAKVHSLQDIRKSYLHLKRLHSDANHVSMAYQLAGLNKAYDEDYMDDGEIGAGRRMLNKLISSDCKGVAAFMVRYFQSHIGPKRFEIHNKLLESAIHDLNNGIVFSSKLPLKQLQPTQPQNTQRFKRPCSKVKTFTPRNSTSWQAPRATQPVEGTRFASAAYNKFSLLQQQWTTTDDESATNKWGYKTAGSLTANEGAFGDSDGFPLPNSDLEKSQTTEACPQTLQESSASNLCLQ